MHTMKSELGGAVWSALFESSPDAMMLVDASGIVVRCNRRALDLFGYTSDELLEKPVEMLVPQNFRLLHRIHREHYTKLPTPRYMKDRQLLHGRHKDGYEVPLEISLNPVILGKETYFLVVPRDASEAQLTREYLRKANHDLVIAYDATIEGWARALELRDKETEGHTQRVTEMTIQLAVSLGFTYNELIQVRRGALLHDIGKVGVPDSILHKQGPLTDDEWVVMKKHPQFAYDLLDPIEYLRPAIVIPHCHHERWDGQGYPRGLRGEQIPLEARLFAVVDVWDALTHPRPYRSQSLSLTDAWAVIESGGSKHFDDKIVRAFRALLESSAAFNVQPN
jgi:PAS domain S-box-containing protein